MASWRPCPRSNLAKQEGNGPIKRAASAHSLGGQIWPQVWHQWPQLSTYPCPYCMYGMDPFDSLRGLCGQMWSQWPPFQSLTLLNVYRKLRDQGSNLERERRRPVHRQRSPRHCIPEYFSQALYIWSNLIFYLDYTFFSSKKLRYRGKSLTVSSF